MIPVVVGDQNVVDPLQVGQAGRGHDALGIASTKAWPTCVDQQGLARRRHNQRSLPTFNVDEIDVQIRVLGCGRYRDEAETKKNARTMSMAGILPHRLPQNRGFGTHLRGKKVDWRATKTGIRCWVSGLREDCCFWAG